MMVFIINDDKFTVKVDGKNNAKPTNDLKFSGLIMRRQTAKVNPFFNKK